jgi:hypothetical protein
MSAVVPDLRGKIYRERRLMQPAETTEFLRRQKVANVGTVDVNGWPYVVPLVYIYEGATCFTFTRAITKATSSPMRRTIRVYALRSQKSGTCIVANPTPVTLLWCTRAWLYSVQSAFCTVQNPAKRNSGS